MLIVSSTEKGTSVFSQILNKHNKNLLTENKITVMSSAGEARRALMEKNYDFVIVDAPLADETGENFARYVASKGVSQVILAVNSEHFSAVSAMCEESGVLVISKPFNNDILSAAFSLARSVSNKLKRIQDENAKLKQKIEDIRIIDRAKCLLISHLSLTEQGAHRFIEKQAMDLRSNKRRIAEEILKTYAS